MEIIKGKIQSPVRAVAYGPEGIGKSTFASQWPQPLFVDVEEGTNHLGVDRIQPKSWSAIEAAIAELTRGGNGYQTIVFDTADWMDRLLAEKICIENNMASIEKFGFGKGYVYMEEAWKRFLDSLARMQSATGCHVLFLAHAQMRKFEQPDEMGSYDRWEMKMSKKTCPILKEWSDLVVFMNYKTIVVEQDGKHKAQGGKRVMFTSHHPCWDAKNRYGLTGELPLAFTSISSAVMASAPPTTATKNTTMTKEDIKSLAPVPEERRPVMTAAAAVEPTQSQSQVAEVIEEAGEKAQLLIQLGELMKGSKITKEELGQELARKGVVPANMNPREYNDATLKRIVAGWTAISHNIALHKQG